MPLPMRKVEPVHIGRGNLPDKYKVQNDLEAQANGTLANIILQLSSLSHHAEEIFGELVRTATGITTRSAKLQSRIDRLTEKVALLDGINEENSLYDCANTKPFQSSASFDQQVVCRTTITTGMLKTLTACDRPPPLEKLNPYRDDGKDGLKFYTDPNYFFELWRQEMLNATEKAVRKPQKAKKDGGLRNKKHIRQPTNTREKQRSRAEKQGEVIMSPSSILFPSDGSGTRIECDDGVVYLPQMTKKSSRPASVEIKHVSFEGVDDENKKYPANEDARCHLGNGYAVHAYSNGDNDSVKAYLLEQALDQVLVRTATPPASSLPSPSTTSDSGIGSSVLNGKDILDDLKFTNGYDYNEATLNQVTSHLTNGHSTLNRNKKRRGSECSQISISNSSRSSLNGFSRPSQPPPAPPPMKPKLQGTPSSNAGTPNGRLSRSCIRDALPPPPPPPAEDVVDVSQGNYPPPPHESAGQTKNYLQSSNLGPTETDDDLPPPPPTPDQYHLDHGMDLPHPPPLPGGSNTNGEDALPPSPPPPPLNGGPPAPPPPPPLQMEENVSNGNSKAHKKAYIPAPVDGRAQLMEAIRGGTIRLRKVDEKKEAGKEKQSATLDSVAEILARRKAFEMSDSDSSESSGEYDSDGWDETSA